MLHRQDVLEKSQKQQIAKEIQKRKVLKNDCLKTEKKIKELEEVIAVSIIGFDKTLLDKYACSRKRTDPLVDSTFIRERIAKTESFQTQQET